MTRIPLLFLNVLIIATCGLIYELLAGTLASYLLGDSVRQFSLIIGIYLFSMGVGAWLSKYVDRGLARVFIEVELAVALIGGLSAPVLFLSFGWIAHFQLILYGIVACIGTLVGLELPLLMRILQDQLNFKDLVSRVLTYDYVGALAASLLFPLLLVPHLGLVRTSLLFGILNAAVGVWATWLLRPVIGGGVFVLRLRGMVVIGVLVIGLINADYLTRIAEENSFEGKVVYAKTSPYQRIVVTANRMGFQLYLNGHLQFSSFDEYRYHEALAHPAMVSTINPERVLILGGGDGLALREVLKYESVKTVTLVDLDPEMTNLSAQFPPLEKLNAAAYKDPRVKVINQDAMIWLTETTQKPYQVALIDFPDPRTFSLGKLYTTRFYQLLKRRLTPDAALGIQCSSPLFAKKSFWCIMKTLKASGFHVKPYQVAVPSFGVWGFALVKAHPFERPEKVQHDLRFLNDEMLRSMFALPKDMRLSPEEMRKLEVNQLNNQVLVHYHEEDWKRFQ